jgi:hypothetical protein
MFLTTGNRKHTQTVKVREKKFSLYHIIQKIDYYHNNKRSGGGNPKFTRIDLFFIEDNSILSDAYVFTGKALL